MPRRSPTIHEKKIPTVSIPINSQPVPVAINSQRPSFLQTIKEGISFGVGSSIGHRIVSAAFGEPTLRVGMTQSENKEPKLQEYEQCMTKYDDIIVCKRILEAKN